MYGKCEVTTAQLDIFMMQSEPFNTQYIFSELTSHLIDVLYDIGAPVYYISPPIVQYVDIDVL